MKTQQLGMMLATAIMLPSVWCFAKNLQQDQPPPAPTPERMLRVSQGVMNKNLLKRVEPVYPQEAKANHIEGDVVLRVRIDREGNTQVVKVDSGDPVLAQAASDAVKHWKYKPMLLNGEPVVVQSIIKIEFQLRH